MTANGIRVINLPMGGSSEAPFALGKQGASWFICFARPYGARGVRKWACINLLLPAQPFLQPSTESHPRFVWNSTPSNSAEEHLAPLTNPKEGPALLRRTNEKVAGNPIVEVLLSASEILHPCGFCRKWETVTQPRFKACGACKAVFYCSEECQRSDWKKPLHKTDCPLLKEGKEDEVEARRRTHSNEWFFTQDRPTRHLDNTDYVLDQDFVTYGARN